MGGKEGEGGRTKGKWRKEVKEGRHEYANFARNKPIFASEFSTKKKVAGVNVLGRSVWIFLFPDAKPILNRWKLQSRKIQLIEEFRNIPIDSSEFRQAISRE